MLEGDVPVHRGRQHLSRFLLFLRVHDISESLQRNPCFTHFRNNAAKRADGPDQHAVIRDKGDKLSGCDSSSNAKYCSHYIHEQVLQTCHDISGDPVVREYSYETDPEPGIILVLLFKSFSFILLSPEGAYYSDSCQILLRSRGQAAFLRVRLFKGVSDPGIKKHRIADHDRDEDRCGRSH